MAISALVLCAAILIVAALMRVAPVMSPQSATDYGVVIVRATPRADWEVWRAEVRHIPQNENNGNHQLYIETWQEQNPPGTLETDAGTVIATFDTARVDGVPVAIRCDGKTDFWGATGHLLPEVTVRKTGDEGKPDNEYSLQIPMWKADRCAAVVIAGNGGYYGYQPEISDLVSGIHTGHADEPPGNTLYHHSFYVRFTARSEAVPTVTPVPTWTPVVVMDDEAIREAAWNKVGVNYNPDAAFGVYAREHGLGIPMSNEFDLWSRVRVQLFTGGIVLCEIGRWDQVRHIAW